MSAVHETGHHVAVAAGGLPFLIPALGDRLDAAAVAARLDGLLLPGARSNVEPQHYDGLPSAPDTPHDPARDKTVLPLIRAAIAADLPVLAICRGIQELNVALGGTLHQQVQDIPGRMDHRGGPGSNDHRYRAKHGVALSGGLAALFGKPEIMVNSLHEQGIDRPGAGLVVEAVAPDGMIEGVRVASAPGWAFGVQWHPEWAYADNADSMALFRAFGEACRAYSVGVKKAA